MASESISTSTVSPQSPSTSHGWTIRAHAMLGFGTVHLAAVIGLFLVPFSWKAAAICLGSYYLRMFGVTAGFHRYFSHRTFRLGRGWQLVMALLAQTSAQKGVLWWASHHRHHHRNSDRPSDIHSPVQRGFWWSHIGWILSDEHDETDYTAIADFAKYPELRWLNRHYILPTFGYAALLTAIFGWQGLVYGYFLSTVLLWHGTFIINSLMHLIGRRVYDTVDDSRNSFFFAMLTMGEGWHNNHHYYPGSAAQGFRWWQLDPTFYLLWLLERIGIVRELRRPPAALRAQAGTGAALAGRVSG